MKAKTRILIADDNADVRADLRILLTLAEKIEIIGEASTGRDAILLSESLHPRHHCDGPGNEHEQLWKKECWRR